MDCLVGVTPNKLAECWDWVEQGLWAIKRKRNEPWFPVHIAARLLNKQAFLYRIEDKGFVILQILDGDDFAGVLHVWCVWGPLKPYEQQIYADLVAMAKQMGVARIRAIGRKGWARRGFFALKGYVYERDI